MRVNIAATALIFLAAASIAAMPVDTEEKTEYSYNLEIKEDNSLELLETKLELLEAQKRIEELEEKKEEPGPIALIDPHSGDLRQKSGVSPEALAETLEGSVLKECAEHYVQAEKEYSVNAFFLAALSIHESGWGTSNIAQQKNNLFGFAAYDHSPFESAKGFDSKKDSIMAAARLLSNDYLSEDGRHHTGGYTISHVGANYATCGSWPSKVASTMQMLQEEIENDDHYKTRRETK